jgi:hypothetical protein
LFDAWFQQKKKKKFWLQIKTEGAVRCLSDDDDDDDDKR